MVRNNYSNNYGALHSWIKKRLSKPILCQNCNKRKAYDLANISQQYKRDLSDWNWLCRKCHMISDGRIFQIKQKNGLKIKCSECGKKIYKKASILKRNKRNFCSSKCSNKFHGRLYRGKKHTDNFKKDISIRMKKLWEIKNKHGYKVKKDKLGRFI